MIIIRIIIYKELFMFVKCFYYSLTAQMIMVIICINCLLGPG